jgi:chaperone modulatory protein CbpM
MTRPRPLTPPWQPPCPSNLAPAWESKMSPSDEPALTGTLVDQSATLSIKDLSRMCNVEERHIVEFVEEGVLTVVEVRSEWHFTGDALRRARLAVRLERDLELNLAGVALALDLIEELQQLRRELEAKR